MPKASGKKAAPKKEVGAVTKVAAKKAVVKKAVKKKVAEPILDSLYLLPKASDVYLWCDYIELRCLVHPDKQFSRQDLIEVIDESRSAGVEQDEAVADDSEFDEDEEADEVEDAAEDDGDGDDDADAMPANDKKEARAADLFSSIDARMALFGTAYPFELSDAGHRLVLKADFNEEQSLYLQLLLSSSLKFVPKTRRKELTGPFEGLSAKIFRGLMPAGWEVHQFGAANSTRYHGHLFTRMEALAQDWRANHILKREDYKATNAGDGGLDLVAWHPLGDDGRVGIPIAAAQCGCAATEWQLKPLEASPATLNTKLWVQHPWATYYFMPQDLLKPQDAGSGWQRRDKLVQSIVIDRLRIVRLARQFGITADYAAPSVAVTEAAAMALA